MKNKTTQTVSTPTASPIILDTSHTRVLSDDARLHVVEEDVAGILQVQGFRAHGVHAGMKRSRRDISLIVSEAPSVGAGVFTQCTFAAAPVLLSREHIAKGDIRAIITNSGNANACTGPQGMEDAKTMAELTAETLGLRPEQIAVCSTGIIGHPLDMSKITSGIVKAAAGLKKPDAAAAAEGILTTDSGIKTITVDIEVGDRRFRIAGIAKGSGMIHPNMATMLGLLVTDAPIGHENLQTALKTATDTSYNMITVDGDTSTNDSVITLANGLEGGPELEPGSPEMAAFQTGLDTACVELAKQIAGDGEGASKLIEVVVEGARDLAEARSAARTVVGSSLVKAAVHGGDPNWGRIVAAIGRSDASFGPNDVTVAFGGPETPAIVFEDGVPTNGRGSAAAASHLAGDQVRILIDLGVGDATATAWGCDLTTEYVTFNSAYST